MLGGFGGCTFCSPPCTWPAALNKRSTLKKKRKSCGGFPKFKKLVFAVTCVGSFMNTICWIQLTLKFTICVIQLLHKSNVDTAITWDN